MNKTFIEKIYEQENSGKSFVVVTLVNIKGSAPQVVGAKLLVGSEGYIDGTVGGGKVEERAIAHAQEMLKNNQKCDYVDWNLQTDVKMTCGGVVSFFFELIQKKASWEIAVFGAGHVAQELVRVLLRLDCSIICIDPRLEWLDKLPEHFKVKKIHSLEMKEIVSTLSPETFIITMTMGHTFDLPILTAALERNVFPYIGGIGSEAKSRVLKNDLRKNGCSESEIEKLYCPIGEPLGNNIPAEIALSIVIQLIKVRDTSQLVIPKSTNQKRN